MKKNTLPLILLAISIVLAVISYLILPETVITQLSFNSSNATVMPKPVAVLIPFALSAGGAILLLLDKGGDKGKNKSLILSVVGLAVYIIMIVFNLAV